MKLIATRLGTHAKADRLQYIRDDGSACENPMPRQGILPHDLVHFIVESRLQLRNGFLALVAGGADPDFATQMAHDAGNQYARSEAIQAEAIVEALQTQLWNGSFDAEAFAYGVQSASAARGIEPAVLPLERVESLLYASAMELDRQWLQVPAHGSIELSFLPATP